MPDLPRVFWTIDRLPVDVSEWRCNAVANGGFDRLTATIPERVARRWRSRISQGALVTGYESSVRVVWEGELDAAPSSDEGRGKLTAVGRKRRAEEGFGRRLYQTRDYRLWQDATVDPFDLTEQGDFEAKVRGSHLWFGFGKGTDTAVNDRAPLCAWVPGALIARYAFTVVKNRGITTAELQTHRFTGPTGARALVATHSLSGGGSLDVDQTVSDPEDALSIRLFSTDAVTNAARLADRVKNLRLNDIAPGDTFRTDEVAADIASAVGYDPAGVRTSDVNALPFDLTQGSWAESGLAYMALLDDWRWLVLEDRGLAEGGPPRGAYLDYGPWERIWTLHRAGSAAPALVQLPVHNLVVVKYRDLHDKPMEVSLLASPDPLAEQGLTNRWEEELTDRQPDATLATAVATAILARVSRPRYAGRIEIVGASDEAGRGGAYAVRPGDLARVAEDDLTHRIYEAEYRHDGVTIGVETPVTAAGLIALAGLRRSRRRWRR